MTNRQHKPYAQKVTMVKIRRFSTFLIDF